MMMTRRGTDRKRDAFTLLELMIVLVILVLLAAVAGRRLFQSQKKAEINIVKAQIKELEGALQDYYLDVRSYPSSEDGLMSLIEAPSDERAAKKWAGPYLSDSVLPVDPWDGDYAYEYPPTRNSDDKPDIWSNGPDGEPDTDDDIGNWPAGASEEGTSEGPNENQPSKDRTGEKRERAPKREPSSSGGGAGSRAGAGAGGGKTE
jgi:general secretion pathway protein G